MAMTGEELTTQEQLIPSMDASQIPDASLSVHEQIREYYGRILEDSDDLKTNAACCSEAPPPKYVLDVIPEISDEVIERFYGCGSPIPPALEGCTVVDLGCGVGRDVYILSKLVGPTGKVIGVDMTPSQLEVAESFKQEHAERFGFESSNVEFKCGFIEDLKELGIEDDSVDLVISNCVINLTPFKEQVFSEIYRILKPGGELYFSDVFCDRRIPEELRNDPVLRGECLGGAMYIEDFRRLLAKCGFKSYVCTVVDDIEVHDLNLETKLGFMSFTSRTIRAIKAEGLEDEEENYGQTAVYQGTIPEMPRYFDLTDEVRLIKGRPVAVSGNMAEMLRQSRYGEHFVIRERGVHRGPFDFDRAQDALALKRGKLAVDLPYLEEALKRIDEPSFEERVDAPAVLTAPAELTTIQVNITYACNLACRHCYLECSPNNEEAMTREVMQGCLDAFVAGGYKIMDITGGSPELHPDFSWFMKEAAKRAQEAGGYIIVRSNLTLLEDPAYEHLMQEMADVRAHLTVSLPYFSSDAADAQRGSGTYRKIISSIRKLNELGYGIAGVSKTNGSEEGEHLQLDLVYNVSGPFLPPPQDLLDDLYHDELSRNQGIRFDDLFAFNNYPLGRFAQDLLDANMFDSYLRLLVENFNALAVQRMMCRDQVNVDVDGRLYDCEVNHVLGLPIQLPIDAGTAPLEDLREYAGETRDATIFDIMEKPLPTRSLRTHPVCYSCAAGFGSSCGGSLV